ncbi:MAG: hypothetical protein OXQ94_16370 [Gemmatimonadota bacterium]|nr:hypothetical protein [Gemmatimonadota bacterium]
MSRKRVVPLALALSAACGDRPPEPSDAIVTGEEWLSESAYRFGDVMAGDALFGRIYVRVTADNRRVFVLEPFQSRVSIWAPDGRRLVDLGRPGQGPGDFNFPSRVDLDDSGFYLRDRQRISYYSYNGKLAKTVPYPPTSVSYQGFPIRVHVLLDDGSFLGVPSIGASVRLGFWGDDPIHAKPVLRIRNSKQGWLQEELLRYDIRNATMAIPYRDGHYFAGQTYADSDWYRLDRDAGGAVLARMVGDDLQPGETKLTEVSALGDTVWRRRLRFEPAKLSQAMLDATIDSLVAVVIEQVEASPGGARSLAEEALYAPEYLPSIRSFILSASSGQVWLQSQERVDTLSVWYSIERGDTVTPPRRVLLPESLEVHDATATHVWGAWKDEHGVNYVVGRRLVPPS